MKPGASLKILIVDDEIVVRDTLTAMMNHFGHATDCAPDGLSAQDIMKENDYDAVFLDIRMPGLDGITLLKWCKEKEMPSQIIIMTGHGEEETRKKALQYGAFAFLNKPFKLNEINELISQLKYP